MRLNPVSKKRVIPSPFREMVKEFYRKTELQERRERMSIQMIRDSLPAWTVICDRPENFTQELIEKFKDAINEDLKFYWGAGAHCEFDMENKTIRCCHPDGRIVILKEEI